MPTRIGGTLVDVDGARRTLEARTAAAFVPVHEVDARPAIRAWIRRALVDVDGTRVTLITRDASARVRSATSVGARPSVLTRIDGVLARIEDSGDDLARPTPPAIFYAIFFAAPLVGSAPLPEGSARSPCSSSPVRAVRGEEQVVEQPRVGRRRRGRGRDDRRRRVSNAVVRRRPADGDAVDAVDAALQTRGRRRRPAAAAAARCGDAFPFPFRRRNDGRRGKERPKEGGDSEIADHPLNQHTSTVPHSFWALVCACDCVLWLICRVCFTTFMPWHALARVCLRPKRNIAGCASGA